MSHGERCFAVLWGANHLSDVRLKLHSTALVDIDADTGEKASLGPPFNTASSAAEVAAKTQWNLTALSFDLHAGALSDASDYFKGRLREHCRKTAANRTSSGSGGAAECVLGSGGPAGPPVVHSQLVEFLEPAEVLVARMVLHWGYTQLLDDPDADTVPGQHSITELLPAMSLADRWLMPGCVEACSALLADRCAAGDVDTINTLLSPVPSPLPTMPAFHRLLTTVSHHLEEALGDVEAVCDAPWWRHPGGLGDKAQHLCLPAILIVLRSNCLRARSENSVLALAMNWLAGEAGFESCDAEKREVLHCVRLGHLTPTFTYNALHDLRWITLSSEEKHSLAHFAAVGLGQERTSDGYTEQQQHLVGSGRMVGPAVWYAAPRDAWPDDEPLVMHWAVTEATLAAHLQRVARDGSADVRPLRSAWRFVNGFTVRVCLEKEDADGGAWLLTLVVELALGAEEAVQFKSAAVHVACGVRGPEHAGYRGNEEEVYCGGGSSVVVHELDEVDTDNMTDIAGWGAYLVDGSLSVECIVHSCK